MSAMVLNIPHVTVVGHRTGTSRKSGKPYKMAILYPQGAEQTMQVFCADASPDLPVNVPLSMQLSAGVDFDGDLRIRIDGDTKFKAL